MCAEAERVTAHKVSNFFHHPSSDKIDDFLRLAGDFNDEAPRYISENDLALILTTVQYPTDSVAEICDETRASPKDAINIFHWMQKSVMVKSVMQSHYYPGYLFVRYAHSFLENLCEKPELLEKVVRGEPVAPDRLEIHTTNATCNYRCQMCLWHVKEQALYDVVADRKILGVNEWNEVLSVVLRGLERLKTDRDRLGLSLQ